MEKQGLFTIDVGGTAIKYGYVEMKEGEPVLRETGSVPISCSDAGEFFNLLNLLYEKHGNSAPGIGLSVPGIVDTIREVNISCVTIRALSFRDTPAVERHSFRCMGRILFDSAVASLCAVWINKVPVGMNLQFLIAGIIFVTVYGIVWLN